MSHSAVKPLRLLFVCTGNICRSPSAEGVFWHLIQSRGLQDRFEVDSAGIAAYHVGERPDPRSMQEALSRGVDLSGQKARKVSAGDFVSFDFLFAMDYGHYSDLKAMAGNQYSEKVHLFMEPIRDELRLSEVPDPYYGGPDGFKNVYDMIEKACEAWLDLLTKTS